MSSPAVVSLPTDQDLSQAFRLIAARIAAGAAVGPLRALRDRLAAEMLGDAAAVGSTLSADFELVTRTGSASHTAERGAVLKNLARMASLGSVMSIELEDLVSDAVSIAAHGVMKILTPNGDDVILAATPIALFLRFEDSLMCSEVIYFDPAAGTSTTLPGVSMPATAHLRELLDATDGPS